MAQGQLRTENETRFKSEPGNKRNKLLKTGTYLIKVIKHHSWRNMKRGEKDKKKACIHVCVNIQVVQVYTSRFYMFLLIFYVHLHSYTSRIQLLRSIKGY